MTVKVEALAVFEKPGHLKEGGVGLKLAGGQAPNIEVRLEFAVTSLRQWSGQRRKAGSLAALEYRPGAGSEKELQLE